MSKDSTHMPGEEFEPSFDVDFGSEAVPEEIMQLKDIVVYYTITHSNVKKKQLIINEVKAL